MALCWYSIDMRIRMIQDIINKKRRVQDVAEIL